MSKSKKGSGGFFTNVSQASNRMVSTAKINSEINKLEIEAEELQFEIGKKYYEANKSEPKGHYGDDINKLNEMYETIHDLNATLLSYKGMRYCPKCDAVVSMEDDFCSKCGCAIPKPPVAENDDEIECPNCGEDNEASTEYCVHCGAPLEQGEKKS